MAKPCPICTHPKRASIDTALAGGEVPPMAPAHFRVTKRDLSEHLAHMRQAGEVPIATYTPIFPADVMSSPLASLELATTPELSPAFNEVVPGTAGADEQRSLVRMFRRAWSHMDTKHQRQELEWLQTKVRGFLQTEDMGL
jgi:hypothetical protein